MKRTRNSKFSPKAVVLLALLLSATVLPQKLRAQISLWVGESYTCDASSAALGLTSDVSWSISGGYLSQSGSGMYRKVTPTQYFSGSATVKCTWKYRLYSGDTWKTQSRTWSIRCKENPVSIHPTSLTLAPGETAYVSYSHQYSNSYTSAANPYFSSSNSSVASVSSSGLVTAKSEGTAYINVYSKISDASDAPYCIVTVKTVTPTGVSLPSSLTLTVGESETLTPRVVPSGASTSFAWRTDDNNIATVSSSGVVTGKNAGTTKVWVTTSVGGYSDYCNITVKEPPVSPTKVTLPDVVQLREGFTQTLNPTLQPDNAETTYTWTSDNTNVATVSTAGVITAKKEGTATLTVTTANGLKASCKLTVKELPGNLSKSRIDRKISIIKDLIEKTFDKTL